MNRLSNHRSQRRLLLNEKGSWLGAPAGSPSWVLSPVPAAACTGRSSASPAAWPAPFSAAFPFPLATFSSSALPASASVSASACTRSRLLSVEILICGIPFGLGLGPSLSVVDALCECAADTDAGEAIPRVEASSSASACFEADADDARVALSGRDASRFGSPPFALVGVLAGECARMSACAFCMRYSSSMTKTELRVFSSSSHPICETRRVRSAYARAQVPRRPGAGRRRRAGSACNA